MIFAISFVCATALGFAMGCQVLLTECGRFSAIGAARASVHEIAAGETSRRDSSAGPRSARAPCAKRASFRFDINFRAMTFRSCPSLQQKHTPYQISRPSFTSLLARPRPRPATCACRFRASCAIISREPLPCFGIRRIRGSRQVKVGLTLLRRVYYGRGDAMRRRADVAGSPVRGQHR